MANLTARFQMIDEMSQKMANLAAGGQTMLDKWESAGDAASAAQLLEHLYRKHRDPERHILSGSGHH